MKLPKKLQTSCQQQRVHTSGTECRSRNLYHLRRYVFGMLEQSTTAIGMHQQPQAMGVIELAKLVQCFR